MTQIIPLNLSGNNLGERHLHLNSLVRDAFQSSVPFESIQDIPETLPVDRLFKIDLASRYRNKDYIIKNLKDADMLFVSRALKCTWLLESEYKNIVNANYLESKLFPEMTSTAVNKMQNWIQHQLRDPERCKDFYVYYKEKEFKIAIKFLWHCSIAYVLGEFENIIDRIDAFNLKVLSERCPQLTKLFYGKLEQNRTVLKLYLDDEKSFFYNLKYVLKSDPDTFFDVTEKYYNKNKFQAFGPDITKHIMVNHRNQFFRKPELYTAWLLDMNILAKYLSHEEVRDVVLKLARAEYMTNWFTYQKVEPLIKRLDKEDRSAFKKLVFVDKTFGGNIKDWPYTPPSSPILEEIPGYSFFLDKEHGFVNSDKPMRLIKKKCCKRSLHEKITKCRTPLDELFDRYRFMGFEATFSELRKRLRAESNLLNREHMMLVLISKAGGREDSLRTLLELLTRYKNEPVHFRAAIVRSLVKRAFVWRLPDDLWAILLEWAHGMGLDGGPSEINCTEGLHAVVLRYLLTNSKFDQVVSTFDQVVSTLFFNNFTYFTEYSLNTTERSLLRTRIPKLILAAAVSGTVSEKDKETRLEQLVHVLDVYKIPFDEFPGFIEAIATFVQEVPDSSEWFLIRLYNARVARRRFFKEIFNFVQNNESYINALRHDISVINFDRFKEVLEYESASSYEQFFRKLVIYFGEPAGLAEQFYTFFKDLAETRPHNCLAKPLSLLAGKDLTLFLKTLDNAPKKSAERSLAAALRANIHNTRPRVELKVFGWHAVGVKAIANLVSVSPRKRREVIVKELITWGSKTIRLALALTENEEAKCSAYKKMVESRPCAALKMFLRYLKLGKYGGEFETIWDTVKPLITEIDYSKRERLSKSLQDVKSVPALIKSEYCVLVYKAFIKIDKDTKYKDTARKALRMLFCIENVCNEIDEEFFSSVVKDLLQNELLQDNDDNRQKLNLYVRLIAKFLLLCDSEETQRERINALEESFFQRFEGWWKGSMDSKKMLTAPLQTFLQALKYNKVFMNAKYVSCMPVFERVLDWMHTMLPIEKWFDVYIQLHLTMLYYKVARLCISQEPDFYTGNPQTFEIGIDMFGAIFGKFIARDYQELQGKYFQSLKEIYRKEIMDYFTTFIDYTSFDYSKQKFAIAVIKSMLKEEETSEAHFLASYVLVNHEKYYFKDGCDLSDVKNILGQTKNNELRFRLQVQSEAF